MVVTRADQLVLDASTASSDDDSNATCGVCALVVIDTDYALSCNICKVWYHIKCTKTISEALYVAMLANGSTPTSLHWFCDSCNKVAAPLMTNMSGLIKEQEKIKSDLASANVNISTNTQNIDKNTTDISSIRKDIDESINIKLDGLINDMQSVQKSVNNIISEPSEIDTRKLNVIISGLPENNPDDTSELVSKVMDILHIECKYDNIKRLGMKRTDGKPRFTRITMEQLSMKQNLISEGKKLRDLPSDTLPFNPASVYISADLTNLQRFRAWKSRVHRRSQTPTAQTDQAQAPAGQPPQAANAQIHNNQPAQPNIGQAARPINRVPNNTD